MKNDKEKYEKYNIEKKIQVTAIITITAITIMIMICKPMLILNIAVLVKKH